MSAADIKRLDRRINELYTVNVAPKYVDESIERLIKDQTELRAELAELRAELAGLKAADSIRKAPDP